MKSWLAKFRISAALDARKPFSPSLRQKIAADPELQRFARRTEVLGRALQRPLPPAPSLHDGIMRAVRTSARQEQPRRAPVSAWLVAPAAVVALVMVFLWMAYPRPMPRARPSLDGAAMVLEMSENMPAAMPSLVMAPLSNEWARVDHDLQTTTQVLLASLP